ncbi:ATP phosphoribosyltransferase [Exiguobacterium sp. s162]|uniref:ATP phosphoribosyltransferase n=1 Tax=Exiguobacterium sp. s162 TaxID=2751276 RepID=UPI001BE9C0A6|nr:ATP phosphoribosyltransferase [Exiguobacterium sp. s162]
MKVAVAKGRIEKAARQFFVERDLPVWPEKRGRELTVQAGDHEFIFVKGDDVYKYVMHGAADVGIVGGDILREKTPGVLEVVDLPFGRCRMAVCGPKVRRNGTKKLKVASKYPNIAISHFASKRQNVEVIALNGSVELAPLTGLADCIVDIVETGATLAANDLEEYETIFSINAKFITSETALAEQPNELKAWIRKLSQEENA